MSRVLGVDLRESFLGLSVLERAMGITRPITSKEIRLPQDEAGGRSAIIEGLREISKDRMPDTVVLGISISQFISRFLELPRLNEKELSQAVPFEFERHLPLPIDEFYTCFLPLQGPKDKKDKTRVIAFAVKRGLIDSLISMFKDAGLDVSSIRFGFLEAMNSIKGTYSDSMVIMADNGIYAAIFQKGILSYIKAIPYSSVDALSAEIERLKDRMEFKDMISISGGLTPELLGIKARSSPLNVAYCLAESAFKRGPFTAEILPVEMRPGKRNTHLYLVTSMSAAVVLLAIVYLFLGFFKDYLTLRDIMERIKAEGTKAAGFIEEKNQVKDIKNKKAFIDIFAASRNTPDIALQELSSIIPKQAWITNLKIDDKGRVEIEGYAQKASSLIAIVDESGFFEGAEFSSPITSMMGKDRFSIRMFIKRSQMPDLTGFKETKKKIERKR